jgi:xanthine dehydrogenase small subunit
METNAPPTTTLLQYLRDHLGRTGTKEGCAEGDCGACTVVVGELTADGVRYRAVNSCIRFMPTIDARVVITSESLASPEGRLHPVQQALVDAHGSQCGFCTPGFVMSLFALYLNDPQPSRAAVVDALSGNLCRCTGYRPIIDAGTTMSKLPEPSHWSRADSQSESTRSALASLERDGAFEVEGEPAYVAPKSLDDLAERYRSAPDSLLLAGGTDVGLWVTKQFRVLAPILYLGDINELKSTVAKDGVLEIGAAVTLTDAYAAIVEHYPKLAEFASRFASPPVRNSGTLCGNLANGSPIGDSMPILIALGARVLLRAGKVSRELALEDLYIGYQTKALKPGEFVVSVKIPLPETGAPLRVATYKIAKRFDQDISAVCAGIAVGLKEGTIVSARIAFGGMGPTPARARHAESALIGHGFSEAVFERAKDEIRLDFQPISDMRASAEYRLEVAANLLRRFYLDYAQKRVPLSVHAL